MKTRALIIFLPALLPLVACSGGSRAETTAAAPRGVPVRTVTVQSRDLADEIVLTGTLKPRAQVQVVAEVQARLLRVERDEGARVGKGEILAVLDETDYRLAHDRARAALAVAEANRAHAVAEKERADNLLKTGGITERDHLAAQVALQVAEASLAQARAEVAIVDQQLARTQVKAPFAGRVAKRVPDPGAMLSAGAPLFTLVDDSVLEFRSAVPSADYSRVKVGAPVDVTIDALPGTRISGKVARVSPLVEERSRSFEAVVEVPGRDGLPGGLFARASVRVGVAKAALVVPPRALLRDGSSPTEAQVFAVVSGKAERRTVTLGVEAADAVQVTKGLAAGEQVVLDPPTALGAGSPVEVARGSGTGGAR
ncbi:MAG TPA: efflux RND transporter periplasmic adaptor subunit [Vicinamibacteria bacterium]|nr:efflux RND transporter periplasmic adaptor subunit [Vicinamibacteria bacterium]